MHSKHRKLKRILLALGLSLSLASAAVWAAPYVMNNRDTRPAPEGIDVNIPLKNKDEYVELYQNERFVYRFKEDTGVIAIEDKRNGYTWASGLDNLSNRQITNLIDDAEREGKTPEYLPQEDRLNSIYTGIANSLVTLEYYDDALNVKLRSIGNEERVSTKFKEVDETHYILTVRHKEPEVDFDLHIRFTDHGMNLSIPADSIEVGEDSQLSGFILAPFMGSTGGIKVHWNEKEQDYTDYIPNEMKPGYVLVPDGSGALIRFRENSSQLQPYTGTVYGEDPSEKSAYYTTLDNAVPQVDPVMPVYGIAHGNQQNAFVAYATEGAEYMQMVVQPDNTMTNYYWAYPKFDVNQLYFQPYNRRGDGYYSLMETPHLYDISVHYDFLQGDGVSTEYAADYVGMARRYRDVLIESGQLPEQKRMTAEGEIPLRLDFLMSEAKKSVIGYKDEVLTSAEEVEAILTRLHDAGLGSINAGLMGWQKGGYTLGRPNKTAFSRAIGSKGAMEDLLETTAELGYDVSFMQDYVQMNEEQIRQNGNVAKHVSGYYSEVRDNRLPLPLSFLARPERSLEWLRHQSKVFEDLGATSYSIDGISHTLISDYQSMDDVKLRTDVQQTINEAIAEVHAKGTVALNRPNQYLWSVTDRFLQAPVYSSQQLTQTDNVPFLQMVLGSSMEVYAPYANFSFYTRRDQLRMIDYNVYPSFILTEASAHLLADTNLISYYSTEFSFYEALIKEVYGTVNEALSPVQGMDWVGREVLAPGVILNHYVSDAESTDMIVNYTDVPFVYEGTEVEAEDFAHVKAKKGGQ